MLKCNLGVLLAERGLKITKVAEETGISRTTITALVNNTHQGIQFDTLNKLCLYLKSSPTEFFLFYPFNISHQLFEEGDQWFVRLDVEDKGYLYMVLFKCFIDSSHIDNNEISYRIEIIPDAPTFTVGKGYSHVPTYNTGGDWLVNYYSTLPTSFTHELEEKILLEITEKAKLPKKAKKSLFVVPF